MDAIEAILAGVTRRAWLILVTFGIALGGCTSGPLGNRAHVADLPLAASHADLLFTLTTASRLDTHCNDGDHCKRVATSSAESRFIRQVGRVAGALSRGARTAYPDLDKRVPNLADRRFDVFVIESDDPSSSCSADGRIALNSELARWHPRDSVLAFIIAREMGHIIARHPEENSVASIATSIIMNLILPGSALLKTALAAGGSRLALTSQQGAQEEEADQIALRILNSSGYRVRSVASALRSEHPPLDDGRWSASFRKSADHLMAEAGGPDTARNAVASTP